MRKLIVFNNVSIDGYFAGKNGEFGWAHDGADDPEFAAFLADNAGGESQLIFGRKTYDLMASYWPTANAKRDNPKVAAGMNSKAKVVFSKSLNTVSWENTELVKGDMPDVIRKMKSQEGPVMVILGSGTIVAQLAAAGLIDEYQLMFNPIALGSGKTLFEALASPMPLQVKTSRYFKNGKSYLCLEPKR